MSSFDAELKKLLLYSVKRGLKGVFSKHLSEPVFITKTVYPLSEPIKGLSLSHFQIPLALKEYAKLALDCDYQPEDILVLDIETSGMQYTGSLAFLIGLGYYEGENFVVEQLFLPHPDSEENSFERLQELIESKSLLVTFNGKSFDIPFLEDRLLYHQIWLNLREKEHFDLLHIARRLWKKRLSSCSLDSIEYHILGHERDCQEDIPGSEIPQVYLNYLSDGDARLLKRVFSHNHDDILYTALLFVFICEICQLPLPEELDGRIDYYALARLYSAVKREDEAKEILISSIERGELNGDIAYELGMVYKKEKKPDEALKYFELAADFYHPKAMIQAAMAYEKEKQYEKALGFCAKALSWEKRRLPQREKELSSIYQRIYRLNEKCKKRDI